MAEETLTIADKISCRICQGIGERARFVKVIKSFTSTAPGRTTPVIWRPPLVVALIANPRAKEVTEWSYSDHLLLSHPEVRGAYVRACLVKQRIEPHSNRQTKEKGESVTGNTLPLKRRAS